MKKELVIFTKNLTTYMDYYNYNQTSLADKMGVSSQVVSKWNRGVSMPQMDKIERMCEIFHCTMTELFQIEQTATSIKDNANEKRLLAYFSRLNSEGLSKVLAYLDDLKAEYFRSDDHE